LITAPKIPHNNFPPEELKSRSVINEPPRSNRTGSSQNQMPKR